MANLRLELGNYTVKMYYRSKCLFNNPNLIVYDLDTLYYLWMGNFAQNVVYHTHFGDCKKTRKNNKIYNLKYKNIIKNYTYINKNSKIDTIKK